MTLKLANLSPVKFSTQEKIATQASINKHDHFVLVVPDNMTTAQWKQLPYGTQLKNLYTKADKKNSAVAISSHLANSKLTTVTLGIVQKGRTAFKNLTQMRKLLSEVKKSNSEQLCKG